ncbi:hypothetical protein L2E82_30989 [Cichorium intybus]|uniref:Uncharacterized protein n=1 Tax=Cichorium intybus TaxID=13427 RepID=A0ACB9D1Y6_CICIN|nr:hypothetical protein L2E82_30989 [Cichorium intybus]
MTCWVHHPFEGPLLSRAEHPDLPVISFPHPEEPSLVHDSEDHSSSSSASASSTGSSNDSAAGESNSKDSIPSVSLTGANQHQSPASQDNTHVGNFGFNNDTPNQDPSNPEGAPPVIIEVFNSPDWINTHIRFRSHEPEAMELDTESPRVDNVLNENMEIDIRSHLASLPPSVVGLLVSVAPGPDSFGRVLQINQHL